MSKNPENRKHTAVLVRDGPPDYVTLSSVAFPTPKIDEAGAILEHSDTGNRFRWSSTAWVQISTGGAALGTNFFFEVSKGNILGHAGRVINASNPQVGTTVEDVWDPGGVLTYATSGEQLEISSTSTNDTLAGTGARTVKLTYLDDSYIRQSEIINMDGTTVATTTATNILRVENIEVVTAGSTFNNVGQLNLTVISAGDVRGAILATKNVSLNGHYTVPAGKKMFFIHIFEEINKNEDIVIEYLTTTGTNGIFKRALRSAVYQNNISVPVFIQQDGVPEKSDVKLTAISTNTLAVAFVSIQIIEVDD